MSLMLEIEIEIEIVGDRGEGCACVDESHVGDSVVQSNSVLAGAIIAQRAVAGATGSGCQLRVRTKLRIPVRLDSGVGSAPPNATT